MLIYCKLHDSYYYKLAGAVNISYGHTNETFLKTSSTLPFFAADCEQESDVLSVAVCERQKCVYKRCFYHSLLLLKKSTLFSCTIHKNVVPLQRI